MCIKNVRRTTIIIHENKTSRKMPAIKYSVIRFKET